MRLVNGMWVAKRALAAAALVAAIGVTAASADVERWRPGASRWDDAVDGNLVDVSVLVSGSSAPLYMRPGVWDRHYFQAFRGRSYALRVRNNTGQRVGVLIAVDGLNVVNGQRSSLDRNEAMYVLDPYESATIKGWRTSLREVRQFTFVDEERSYANRTDQANGDMGWIRVLAFREQRPIAWWNGPRVKDAPAEPFDGGRSQSRDEARRDEAPAPAPGTLQKSAPQQFHGAPQAETNPGTGWGDRQWDPVNRTQFLAEWNATDRINLRYEYASGLRALGIFPRRERTWERDRGELGFAPPPRW